MHGCDLLLIDHGSDLFRLSGARCRCFRQEYTVTLADEELDDGLRILVLKRSEDEDAALVRVLFLDRFLQCFSARRIVCAVHDERDTAQIMDLKAALPLGTCKTFTQVILIDSLILLHDERERHGRDSRIDCLMRADERHEEETVFEFLGHVLALDDDDLSMTVLTAGIDLKVSSIEIKARFLIMRFFFQLLQRYMLGCGDDRDALFDDTGLLMCDLLQILAEVFLVVHRYIRDDGNDRDDDIRRVVEPAHTDLHDSVVDLLFFEIPERHSRQEFKFRRSFDAVSDGFFCGFADDGRSLREVFLRNIMACDVDALGVIDEMRGNVATDFECRIFQHTGDHSHHAALAVRTGDMDDFVSLFRMIQTFKDGFDAFEARLDPEGCRRFQIGDRFFVIHDFSLL